MKLDGFDGKEDEAGGSRVWNLTPHYTSNLALAQVYSAVNLGFSFCFVLKKAEMCMCGKFEGRWGLEQSDHQGDLNTLDEGQ
jgi:hypothetical protein